MQEGKITFLKPVWAKAHTFKTFQWTKDGPEEIEGELTENFGAHFKCKSGTVRNLEHLKELLYKAANSNLIRIAGVPNEGVNLNRLRRNKETFSITNLQYIYIDVDGWIIPPGYDISTPEGYIEALTVALKERSLDLFCDCDCLVLQSQSSWPEQGYFKCHYYVWLSGDGVNIEDLHEWAMTFNKLKGEKILDPAVYRVVQPDFIAKRKCIGFHDPMPEEMRLFVHDSYLNRTVNSDELVERMRSDEEELRRKTDPSGGASGGSDEKRPKLGETWAETLKLAGTEHGINEVCFRAAAQLVSAIGFKNLESQLDYYAKKFETLLWQSVAANNPDRGSKKDRAKYPFKKIRDDYLASAIKKQFGSWIQDRIAVVNQTIQAIIDNKQRPSSLYEADILDALKDIYAREPSVWMDIEDTIKTKLKGKVTITELKKRVVSNQQYNFRQLVDEVVKMNRWVTDHGNKYVVLHNSDNYFLRPMAQVRGLFFEQAMNLLNGAPPPMSFETKFMDMMDARAVSPKTSPFEERPIRMRTYNDASSEPSIYINLGMQPDGQQKTAVVTADSIQVTHSKNVNVMWMDTNSLRPILLPSAQTIKDKFGENIDPYRSCAEYLVKRMPHYVQCLSPEAHAEVVAWVVNCFVAQNLHIFLELIGPPRSGKTTAGDFLQDLVSPVTDNIAANDDRLSPMRSEREYMQAFRDRFCCLVDNYYKLSLEEQRMYTQMMTGGKHSRRELYRETNVTIDMFKPVIVTSYYTMVTQADLQDRTISIEFNPRDFKEEERSHVMAQWMEDKPILFVGVLHMIREVLREYRKTKLNRNDRTFWFELCKTISGRLIHPGRDDEEIKELIDDYDRQSKFSSMFNYKTLPQLVAWILSDDEIEPGTESTPSALYHRCKEWMSRQNKTYMLNEHEVEVHYEHVPPDVRAFSRLLSQGAAEIALATGLTIERTRTNKERKLKFTLTGSPRCVIVERKDK